MLRKSDRMVVIVEVDKSVIEYEKDFTIVQCLPASFEVVSKFNRFANDRYDNIRALKDNCMNFWDTHGQAMYMENMLYIIVGERKTSRFELSSLREAITKMKSLMEFYGIRDIFIPIDCFEEYGYSKEEILTIIREEIIDNENDIESGQIIISSSDNYDELEGAKKVPVTFKATTVIKEVINENKEERTCECPDCGTVHKRDGAECIFLCSNCNTMLHREEWKDILKKDFMKAVKNKMADELKEINEEETRAGSDCKEVIKENKDTDKE